MIISKIGNSYWLCSNHKHGEFRNMYQTYLVQERDGNSLVSTCLSSFILELSPEGRLWSLPLWGKLIVGKSERVHKCSLFDIQSLYKLP